MIAVATPEPKPGARYPGDSRPPFEPGNTVAFRHGARSSRVLRPIADELARELVSVAPWTASPVYAAEVAAWAWNEARCRMLRAYEDEHGLLSDEGASAAGELHRAETRAATARANLGIGGPLALARVLGSLSTAASGTDDDALEALKAEGRRIVEARTAALASVAGSAPQAVEAGRGGEEVTDD